MNVLALIAAATERYKPAPEHMEVSEWDRTSPINDVPAAEVIASFTNEFGEPDPNIRVVVLRVTVLDIIIYLQRADPATGRPLRSDTDVERVVQWMKLDKVAELLGNEGTLKAAVQGALGKRLMQGLAAEAR